MTDTYRLNQYLNRAQAAEFLGVTARTLITWEKTQKTKIRVYRHPINDYPLYKIEDLHAFLKAVE
jgi:hypothetical protein